ncbi:hypothetical protein pb186bvf_015312 [Paramecium bursaria]
MIVNNSNMQRRVSPAPSSPLPRSAYVQQHSNRMQFLQGPPMVVQYQHQTPQYQQAPPLMVIKTEENNRMPRHSQEKENINVKAFQTNNNKPDSLQNYIDTALRNQREETQRLLDQQQQQIKCLSQWQKQYEETEFFKQMINSKVDFSNITKQLNELQQQYQDIKETQSTTISNICTSMIQTQKQEQHEIQQIKQQINQLKDSISQSLRSSISLKQSQTKREEYDYSYKTQPSQISLDTYDQYIKKYESFNKQVNDYLLNRKLPEHLNNILQNDVELTDSLEYQDFRRSEIRSKSEYEESPIKVLDETAQGKVSPVRITKEEIDKIKFQYKCKMSTITENDNEEDELIYHIDENGYILNQDGHHLLDNYGRYMQLQEKDIEYFKSKNLIEEIK